MKASISIFSDLSEVSSISLKSSQSLVVPVFYKYLVPTALLCSF